MLKLDIYSILHALAGLLSGVMTSWTINCTMVEISISPMFSIYFGMLFLIIGAILSYRLNQSIGELGGEGAKRQILQIFSGLIVLSGILCFILDKKLFNFPFILKIPLYGVLGITTTFTFTFSALDIMNYCWSKGGKEKGFIELPQQIYLILGGCVVLGAVFGLIFGTVDVEDFDTILELREKLFKAEEICLPIGALVGSVVGYLNYQIYSDPRFTYNSVDSFGTGTAGDAL